MGTDPLGVVVDRGAAAAAGFAVGSRRVSGAGGAAVSEMLV